MLRVPTYGVDFRRLINLDWARKPLPDVPLLGGPLRVRLAQYVRARRAQASNPYAYIGMAGGREPADGTLRVLSASEYLVASLSHRATIGAVLVDLSGRKLPTEQEREAELTLLRAFRDRFAGWLLPPVVLDLIQGSAPRPRRDEFFGRIEAIRMAITPLSVPLDAARDTHEAARAELLELATSPDRPGDLELATMEFVTDLLYVQRASVEDVIRARMLVPEHCETVTRALLCLDRKDDLDYDQAIGHVLTPLPIASRIPGVALGPVSRALGDRVQYCVHGVLDPDGRARAEANHENRTAPTDTKPPAATGSPPPPRLSRGDGSTHCLEELGVDLTRLAAAGSIPEVVGREDEISEMVEILCRRNKRNPVLIGPPGTGKTAIVSGLAGRLANGQVPRRLAGSRLVEIQVASILAGTQSIGDIEDRVLPLIAEASHNRVILFFDEVHQLVGAGAYRNNDNDIAQILKPALARGDLALIGATTAAEYRHFIQSDAALERRFQPLEVAEPDRAVTLTILESIRNAVRKDGIEVSDAILEHLVRLSHQVLPGRYQPDKAVDLLEQVVARAAAYDQSLVTMDMVDAAVVRMTGYPPDLGPRLESLAADLRGRALMGEDDVSALVRRLRVTLGGLSVQPARPRAVVVIPDDEDRAAGVAEAIAAELFGSARRCHRMDLGRIFSADDLDGMLGGRRGHRSLADSAIQQACRGTGGVLVVANIGLAAPIVRSIFVDALRSGRLLDAGAAELRLTGLVVLLAGAVRARYTTETVGFRSGGPTGEIDHIALESDLRGIADVVARPVGRASERVAAAWIETVAVPRVVAMLHERRLQVAASALARRLTAALGGTCSLAAVDRWVEYVLLPEVIEPGHASAKPRRRTGR